MRDQLREELRELAVEADVAQPRVVPDSAHVARLWRAGRRRRRARAFSATLVAGALVVLVGGVVQVVRGVDGTAPVDGPADRTSLAVPDHFWSPSSWATTVGEGDAPGPLALIAAAERRSPWLLSTSEEWYGVTATGQSYVWLRLPDRSRDESAAVLSPDGRRVGYLLGGTPDGARHYSDVVGLAVYDSVTGQVFRHRVATAKGLAPYELAWTPDGRRLVASYGQYRTPNGSSLGRTVSWDADTGNVALLAEPYLNGPLGSGLGGITSWSFGKEPGAGVLVIDPVSGERRLLRMTDATASSITGVGGSAGEVVLSPDGTLAAISGDLPVGRTSSTTGLHVARVVDGKRIDDARLLGSRWQLNRILGWLDDHRVLADAHPRGGTGLRYVAYDVRAGSVEPVIRHTDPPGRWLSAQFAQDLLRDPLAPGRAPDSARPRWALPALTVGVLAGAAVIGASRRRRRRRAADAITGGGRS